MGWAVGVLWFEATYKYKGAKPLLVSSSVPFDLG